MEKDYILEEAKYVLLNYVSKYETKTENTSNKLLEKKYKKIKKDNNIYVSYFSSICNSYKYILIENKNI